MAFQLGAALLDACVLSVLEKEDTYGYVLTQNVREVMSVSESTLYPYLEGFRRESILLHMISRLMAETEDIIR